MVFNVALAREIAATYDENIIAERGLIESFTEICHFLSDEPNFLSWRGKVAPSVADKEGLKILAERYYGSYRSSNFPALPGTVPDEMVSIVMQEAYGYSIEACKQLKIDHQHSMCAENCIGALLERYLDSVLRPQGWHWCCGDFVKAIDFIRRNQDGTWLALQVKNRDNSENSSSSAIRKGTAIQKWFRTFSKKEATNWVNLPPLMQGYNLSEEEFIVFVRRYLTAERSRRNPSLAKSI